MAGQRRTGQATGAGTGGLTEAEVRALLGQMEGRQALMARILYGAGLRLMECVRLRVKDVDFGYSQITIRDGNGKGPGHDIARFATCESPS